MLKDGSPRVQGVTAMRQVKQAGSLTTGGRFFVS
jgi:hypothetical protein